MEDWIRVAENPQSALKSASSKRPMHSCGDLERVESIITEGKAACELCLELSGNQAAIFINVASWEEDMGIETR